MCNESKKDFIDAIRPRYLSSSKKQKQLILDEVCLLYGYNRKYAIRVLNKKQKPKKPKKSGRKKKYNNPELISALKSIWISTNLICSKRLKAVIPLWIDFYQGNLTEENKELLCQISASTIDRLLKPIRNRYRKRGLATTKPGSLIKKKVPVKTNQWDETRPGYIEADTVAHCGGSLSGSFVYTVNAVDIATGWIESRAIWGKGQRGTFEAIKSIEKSLPFKILGFDTDNGSEFLNWHLVTYFSKRKRPVQYTRARAYHKNDNAHIEGKNWTHIRQYFGYHRFDDIRIVNLMNELFLNEWSDFFNFFIPSSKTVEKYRDGAKIIKKFDEPKTPFQRVIESEFVPKKVKTELIRRRKQLNPFLLQKAIVEKIKLILRLV